MYSVRVLIETATRQTSSSRPINRKGARKDRQPQLQTERELKNEPNPLSDDGLDVSRSTHHSMSMNEPLLTNKRRETVQCLLVECFRSHRHVSRSACYTAPQSLAQYAILRLTARILSSTQDDVKAGKGKLYLTGRNMPLLVRDTSPHSTCTFAS